MKRYTSRYDNGQAYFAHPNYDCTEEANALAAYEDTGLTPDEIDRLNAELAAYKEANPPRVHGRWIGHLLDWHHSSECHNLSKSDYLECSLCHGNYYIRHHDFFGGLHRCRPDYDRPEFIPNCCPNCHAIMDRKEKP